jgi:multidrug efflux pump subunit AcrB
VILEVQDKSREHPEDLDNRMKSDDGKELVPLSALAQWKPSLGPQTVNHLTSSAVTMSST